MSAKELLRSVREAENKYRISKELAERLRYNLFYRGQNISGADVSPASLDNTYENNLVNMIDLENTAERDEKIFLELRAKALEIICSLDDLKEREVLIRRYIYSEHWNQISAGMNYSVRQVQRYHGQALKKLSQK